MRPLTANDKLNSLPRRSPILPAPAELRAHPSPPSSGSCPITTTWEGRSLSLALSSGGRCYLYGIFKHYGPTASRVRSGVWWEVNGSGGGRWTGHHEHALQWGGTDSESEDPSWRGWMYTVSHSSLLSPLVSLLRLKLAFQASQRNDTQQELSLPNLRFGEPGGEDSRWERRRHIETQCPKGR